MDAVKAFNADQDPQWREICDLLFQTISETLPKADAKVWHGAPVWFLDGNPIVGYDILKDGARLLFWSGQSFGVAKLQPEGKFKAAEARFRSIDQIEPDEIKDWLKLAETIQWDYKNIVKNKGVLNPLKGV